MTNEIAKQKVTIQIGKKVIAYGYLKENTTIHNTRHIILTEDSHNETIAQIEKTIDERIKELKESIAMAIELDSMLNDSTTDVLVYEQQIKVLESIKSEISKLKEVRI
jgi:hypothetical protein